MHYISRSFMFFSHTFVRTSLCISRTHIESRFCNPHVVFFILTFLTDILKGDNTNNFSIIIVFKFIIRETK
jgi:hypothetical protein